MAAGDPPPPNINVTVDGAGLDTYIPAIPEVRETDIQQQFKVKILTPIEGRPSFDAMQTCERELSRNALAIKVPFGGGKRGCLGLVCSAEVFLDEAGVPWEVPETEGAYPTFPDGATTHDKKKVISDFIEREKGIKTVEVTEELLKGQFLEAVDEDYVVELKEDLREYDGVPLRKMLRHVKDKYAKMDDDVLTALMAEFDEPPDMSLPIDKYFAKQERCKRLVRDSETPITEAEMVRELSRHMGKTANLPKATVKFRKKPSADRTWKKAKEYYREALEDADQESRAAGTDVALF